MDRGLQKAEVSMTCLYCQGKMTRASTPLHVDRNGCHVVLDSVPAWICAQCGESYFEEREVDLIQDLVRSVEQNAKKIAATG